MDGWGGEENLRGLDIRETNQDMFVNKTTISNIVKNDIN